MTSKGNSNTSINAVQSDHEVDRASFIPLSNTIEGHVQLLSCNRISWGLEDDIDCRALISTQWHVAILSCVDWTESLERATENGERPKTGGS